jgi:hypothetical protein
MSQNDFLCWLQGYILGVTGTQLSDEQVDRIHGNLVKVTYPPQPGQTPFPVNGQSPTGELYRC